MGKKALRISLILIFILAFATAESKANTWKGNDLIYLWRTAAWKIGPFHIRPALIVNNVGYDSNVYYSPEPVKDYGFTAGPALDIYLAIRKKIMVQIYESPQYVYFNKLAKERTWNNYFQGEVYFLFNKWLFSLGSRLEDAREKWNTEIDIRPRRKEERFFASFMWQPSKKSSFSLGYTKTRYDYENLEEERYHFAEWLNREEIYVNGVWYYQISFRTRIFLEGGYGVFTFDNPLAMRDSKSLGLYGGFEFSPLGRIQGRIRLGYRFVREQKSGAQYLKGFVGDSNVQVRLLRTLSLRGLYRSLEQFSAWETNTYYIENNTGLGASLYVLRQKIRIDYDYKFGRNSYLKAGKVQAGSRVDKYDIHSLGVYFRVKSTVGIGLTAGRWRREIKIRDWKDERNFVSANVTYNF